MATKKNIGIGGVVATGAGILALTNSIGWALLIIGVAVAAVFVIRFLRK